jgi:hypothetical protein
MIRRVKRMFGMEKSHEDWLAENPGKSSEKYVEAEIDQEERDRVRQHMEEDLEHKREQRGEQ